MYSVQAVFDKAIHWIDAQNESTGSTNTADTKEYALRTPDIINLYLNVVYPYSDTYLSRADGRRPFLGPVSNMADELDLDAYICMSVLPFALAAGLLVEENDAVANAALQIYQENLARAAAMPAAVGEVEDVYGGLEHGQYGRWT